MMIEPIGLVGTLIAIVQISGKLVSLCYDHHNGVKAAPREILQCLGEVIDVRNVVETLLKIAGTDTNADLPTLQSMNEPASPLRQCLTELLNLKALLKPDKTSTDTNSKLNSTNLLWPLRRTEVKKCLDAIARIKATLQLAVSADNA
jgi:hypothetical protein